MPGFLGGYRPVELDERGLCLLCTALEEGWTLDRRSALQRHLGELAGGDDEEGALDGGGAPNAP